jgi:argininosuccinate lyase
MPADPSRPAASAKAWQGRLAADTDEQTARFVASLDVDLALWRYDIAGSIVHAQMLHEVGLLTRDEFRQIKKGLLSVGEEIEAGRLDTPLALEDIHMVVEKALIDLIGEPGRKLHTGRSRNDQVALDLRLWARDAVDDLTGRIVLLQRALVDQADRNGRIIMPAYTHLQRAQPILAGQAMLAYVEMLQRDADRLTDARVRIDVCPLGSGAVAGTSLPLNRRRTAELLGFPAVSRNSIDATADRDFLAELLFGCAMLAVHLSRLAEDWIVYSTTEFGFIELDDAYCTSSSMMPQKKNADTLELVRGKAATASAALTGLLTLLKGLPLAYNRDLQDDKRFALPAVEAVTQAVTVAAGVVGSARFRADRIQAGLDEGYLDATALAEYLVGKGVPFRTAHHAVGQLVARASAADQPLGAMELEELRRACPAIEQDVYDYLGAANVVARYAPEGAAGVEQLQAQLEHWHETLAETD